jgi:hypothetical protein
MIAIHFIEGLSCPFFVCDVCGKRITDPLMATAVWGEHAGFPERGVGDDGTSVVPAHVHKGACWQMFASRLAKGQSVMDDELSDHVEFLLKNSGLRARETAAP